MSDAFDLTEISDLLTEAYKRVALIETSLPKQAPEGIFQGSKLPFKALEFRECLMWRSADLARSALACYELDCIVAAITLTRSLVETIAALYHLNCLMKEHITKHDIEGLDAKLMTLLLGRRNQENMPEHLAEAVPTAINCLTFIAKMDKKFNGIKRQYERLCEFAHPNHDGVVALYSRHTHEPPSSSYGKPKKSEYVLHIFASNLNFSLVCLEHYYNKTGGMMDEFISVCNSSLSAS